ncbi:MAG TPA: signal peptidase I [Acidimicrobiales bacterium]|nr:signal peptidase I [Acidimicrobiales bacterium]
MTASGPSGPGAVLSFGPPPVGRLRVVVRAVVVAFAALLVVFVGLGLVVGPHVFGYRVLFVRTASMEPTLPVGSLLVVRQVDAADVESGDILTFSHPDSPERLVTHRVVRRDGEGFVTQGDASTAADPWRIPATGSGWRYAFSLPGVGFLLGYLRSGMVSTVALALTIVACSAQFLRLIWRPAPAVSC